MPDAIDIRSDAIQDRLADLGEQFNTNKSFGLMGMLEGKQEQTVQAQEPAAVQEPQKDEKPPEWFEPLNSSLRAISESTTREFGQLRNELSSLRQQPVVQQQEAYSDDPYAQKINQLEQNLAQTKINTAWERARNSLNSARQKFGEDFDYKDEELVSTWRQHIGANQAAADATNWDVYFKQQYDTRRIPKLEQRINQLQAESMGKSSGKDVMSNLGALPRGNRNGAPQPSSRSNSDFDEDVYRKANARMGKGQFKGFNRLLVEEQNRKLLRTAS